MQNKINEIIEILKKMTKNRCCIALAGAHAKGVADNDSDIDIYMFIDEIVSYQERVDLIKNFADSNKPIYISETYDDAPWGGSIDFYYQGTPVETVVRFFTSVEKIVNDCIDGRFEIIPATWTSNGYYTFIYLSEISFIIPLYDSENFIGHYKEKLKKYPPLFKKAIIERFFNRANTWLNNFHYKSAIKRMDILFTSPIVLHTILDMIQVIYALNEKYFTGDKKLKESLEKLEYCPVILIENLEFLLSATYMYENLNKQHELLCAIQDDLKKEIMKVIN